MGKCCWSPKITGSPDCYCLKTAGDLEKTVGDLLDLSQDLVEVVVMITVAQLDFHEEQVREFGSVQDLLIITIWKLVLEIWSTLLKIW